jgi:hypothetical protein
MTFKVTGQPKVGVMLNTDAPGGPKPIASAGQFAQHIDKLAAGKVKADLSSRLDRVWLVVLKGIESLGVGNTSAAQKVVSNRLARNVINRLNDEPITYPNGTPDFLGDMLVKDLGIDLDNVQLDDGFNALLKAGLDGACKTIVDKNYAAIELEILASIDSKFKWWMTAVTKDVKVKEFVHDCFVRAANYAVEHQETINLDTVLDNVANALGKLCTAAEMKADIGSMQHLIGRTLEEYTTNGRLGIEELLRPNKDDRFQDLAEAFALARMPKPKPRRTDAPTDL